jgi:small-conductance mechanosensitive channel
MPDSWHVREPRWTFVPHSTSLKTRQSCDNGPMSIHLSPHEPTAAAKERGLGEARVVLLLALFAVLGLCVVFSWTTRDAMAHLPFLRSQRPAPGSPASQKNLVDLSPWQTAQALAPLAVSAEEADYAREAERLADHEVDQAFASALRQASTRHAALSGAAVALSQRVAKLQQTVKEDQALVQSLTAGSGAQANSEAKSTQPAADSTDLEIAKAQLGLDSDQLADAQQDLARATGDERTKVQQELATHEASMQKYDAASHGDGQIAILSAGQYGTLAGRVKAWMNQRSRDQLIQQALQQTQGDTRRLTAEHNALAAQADRAAPPAGGAQGAASARLADIKRRSEQNQILSLYDDRIQTQQQLAAVYGKWSAQLLLQHRIVVHLILQSVAEIACVLICVIVCDWVLFRLLERPGLDRRRMQTLRTIFTLSVQAFGAVLILMILFGVPRQMPTILGLATAGLTVALQDFILAFMGWFVLMGKNGVRVGDWVEINGVGGEVVEIGLFRTTMLETGNWTDNGHPTGRRVTFINSFAIRGQYFNFSTNGQWMWDEFSISVPVSVDLRATAELIRQSVLRETARDTQIAEQEWKRATKLIGLNQFSANPAVNLRPSGSSVDIIVRYVTRASDRFDLRNRLYQQVMDVLHKPEAIAVPIQHEGSLVEA